MQAGFQVGDRLIKHPEAEGGETLAPQDGVGRGGQLLPSGKVAPIAHIDVGQEPMGSLFSQLAQAFQPTERGGGGGTGGPRGSDRRCRCCWKNATLALTGATLESGTAAALVAATGAVEAATAPGALDAGAALEAGTLALGDSGGPAA